MYPAGSFLVANSEQEEGERVEFYPIKNEREPGTVAIWGISGHNVFPKFLESQQGTGTLVSFILHWAAPFSPPRELTETQKFYLSMSELAIHVPGLTSLMPPGIKAWVRRTRGWQGPRSN